MRRSLPDPGVAAAAERTLSTWYWRTVVQGHTSYYQYPRRTKKQVPGGVLMRLSLSRWESCRRGVSAACCVCGEWSGTFGVVAYGMCTLCAGMHSVVLILDVTAHSKAEDAFPT